MDFEDRMIEAFERGECCYEDAYEFVRDELAMVSDRVERVCVCTCDNDCECKARVEE